LIAKTKEIRPADPNNAHYVQKLYAIDITTGTNRANSGVVTIGDTAYINGTNTFVSDTTAISVPGTGTGSVGGILSFNARKENDRMSLQLVPNGANKTVYLAFASHGDNGPYHGWIIGYNAADLSLQKVYNTSPNGSASGIWESGGNLGFDAQGYLYFSTGNGFVQGGTQGFNANYGGVTALGAGSSGLGYAAGGSGSGIPGIGNSLAVTFRAFDHSSTGLGTNGSFTGPTFDLGGNTGIDFNDGAQDPTPHTYQVTLSYSGTTLTETIMDLTANMMVTQTYDNVNIPALVGGTTAYVGFTAGTGTLNAEQDIKTWMFTNGATTTIDHGNGFANAGDLTLNGSASIPAYPVASPVGIFQYHQDIGIPGDPLPAGNATYNSSTQTYTLTASGTDIGFKANQYDVDSDREHFLYNPVSGDGEIIARVTGLTNTNFWTKAALQVRESLDPQARNFQMVMSPHNQSEITWRDNPPDVNTNGLPATTGLTGAQEGPANSGPVPGWIRVVRSGSTFTGYWATDDDGTPGTWVSAGSHTITGMGRNAYVGLGLTSHANGLTATATFDHVQVVSGFNARTPDPVAVLTPAANNQVASLFANNKVDVANFFTTFTFQMRAGSNPNIADGMTFTIQNASPGSEISESVVKLSTTGAGTSLPVADYFTPHDWKLLDNNDSDLGSGGTLLLPVAVGSSAHPHLIVETGKTGRLYLIDRDNMGKVNSQYDHIVQIVTLAGTGTTPGVWGNPAFFQDGPDTGILYYWGSSSPGLAFRITDGVIDPTPLSQTAVTFGFPGAQPSISSDGMNGSSAIMWALRSDNYGSAGPEVLYAYDAENLAQPLWKSDDLARPDSNTLGCDEIGGSSVKFTFPIVSNGHVYAGSNGSLAVYGLRAAHTNAPATPTNFQVSQVPPEQGGDTKLKLTWTNPPPPNDATYISIKRAASASGPFNEIARVCAETFLDTGLMPLTPYWYQIQAVNQAGSSDLSAVQNNITRLPGARLGVPKVASAEVDLSWTIVGSDATYNIERSTDHFATFITVVSNLPHSPPTYVDTTVMRPNTYYYRVHAFNASPADESFSNVVVAVVAPVDIEFPFPDGIQNANGLQVNGSALFSADEHILRLTNDFNQASSVFTGNEVSASEWSTTFWIRLHEGTQPNIADGLTFTLQANSPTALGAGGGGLGYQGIHNSVAIKFDVFDNQGETNNSTGVFVNGDFPGVAHAPSEVNVPLNPAVVNLRDQHRKRIDIDYDVSILQLHVKITDEQHDGGPTSVEQFYTIDIPSFLGQDAAYVGFTGGTGGNYSLQDILGWVLPPTKPAGPSNLQATAGNSNDAMLEWTANSTNELGVTVQRSLDGYHFFQIAQLPFGANTYHDTDPSLDLSHVVYYYRVGAFNTLGTGYSNAAVLQLVGMTINHSDIGGGFGSTNDLQTNGTARFYSPVDAGGSLGIFTADRDIGTPGDPATPGSASFENGVYTLQASGDDIYNNSDAFHFAYVPLHGDGQITARVTSLDPTKTISDFTKAGVMIRETLTADSREVSLVDTRDHSFRFQRRANVGGSTDRGPDSDYPDLNSPLPPPLWLRLRRQGNVFTAFWSADGNTWTRLDGPQTINMATDVFIGLALTAHNNDGRLDTATFDNVTVNTAAVLTDGRIDQAGSIFAAQRLPVTGTFTTSFVMNINTNVATGSGNGLTFVLQADSRGASALGGSGAALGYGAGNGRAAIMPSVAIKFDLFSQGSHAATTGLYRNGNLATGQVEMTGIDFRQNHTYQVDLNYDGLTLRETIKDLVSDRTFTTSYAINLRSVLGADTAYAGFTAGTSSETAWIALESWTAIFNPLATPPHLEAGNVTPRAPQSGELFTFTVSQRTPFGPTVGYVGTVHFASSDPNAILPHSYTFTTADAGLRTFTAVLLTVGPQTITVTDDAGLTDSISVVVTPVSFLVNGFPSPTTSGDEHSFTVMARDFFGNTATGYVGTVHFTSTDLQAVLPADYTFTAADAGMHTFTATLKTAGTQSLTVADKLRLANSIGTQSGIVVEPAALDHFVVAGFPPMTIAGVAHDFTVTAKDLYGNTVTGYVGTVHLSSNDTQADFSPNDYMFTSDDAGVHTFTVTLKTAGSARFITVRDNENNVQATQNGIQVTPAAAVRFLVMVLGNPVAGIPVDVFVTAVDAYDNTGAIYTGTVHVSSDDFDGFDYPFQANERGNHVFSVTFRTHGHHYVRVEDKIDERLFGEQDDIPVE
jgi:hypothetical protein